MPAITKKRLLELKQRWSNSQNIVLKPEQRKVVDAFVASKFKRVLFGLQAGTGKTYSSLTWLKENDVYNFTVVAPSNILEQWSCSVVDIYQNDVAIVFLQQDAILKKQNLNYMDEWVLFQTSRKGCYASILDKNPNLKGIVFIVSHTISVKLFQHLLSDESTISMHEESFNFIVDESQFIKHASSKSSQSYMKFNKYFNYLALLTGSIFSNDIDQTYTQFCLLNNFHRLTKQVYDNTYFTKQSISLSSGRTIDKTGYYKDDYINVEYNKNILQPKYRKSIYKELLLSKLSCNGEFLTNDDLIPHEIKYHKLSSPNENSLSKLKSFVEEGVDIKTGSEYDLISVFTTPVSKLMKMRQLLCGYNYFYKINKSYGETLSSHVKASHNENYINELINGNTHQSQLTFNELLAKSVNNKQFNNDVTNYIENFVTNPSNKNKDPILSFLQNNNFGREIVYVEDNERVKLLQYFIENTLLDFQNPNIVVFYQETGEREILLNNFKKFSYEVHIIDGKHGKVHQIIDHLRANEEKQQKIPQAVLIQIKSGAQGIDGLQHYVSNVLWYMLPFSSELWEQANARIHRIGQEEQTNVFYMSLGHFDEKIYTQLKLSKSIKDEIFYKEIVNSLYGK